MFEDAAGCGGTGRTKWEASSGWQTTWQRSTTSELSAGGKVLGATVPICTRAESVWPVPNDGLVLSRSGHVGSEDEAVRWCSGDDCNAR